MFYRAAVVVHTAPCEIGHGDGNESTAAFFFCLIDFIESVLYSRAALFFHCHICIAEGIICMREKDRYIIRCLLLSYARGRIFFLTEIEPISSALYRNDLLSGNTGVVGRRKLLVYKLIRRLFFYRRVVVIKTFLLLTGFSFEFLAG